VLAAIRDASRGASDLQEEAMAPLASGLGGGAAGMPGMPGPGTIPGQAIPGQVPSGQAPPGQAPPGQGQAGQGDEPGAPGER